jgi:hypothetical protein
VPLKKLLFRPGVSRENTRYLSENVGPAGINGAYSAGWYDCDKVRFRSGSPEKIGGWERISVNFFLGVCRSMWNWVTLDGLNLIGVGTNLKFYIERGGAYYDITPLRSYTEAPVTLTNPFSTTSGLAVIVVADTAHGLVTGDVANFSGAVAVGGIPPEVLNTNHTVTVTGVDSYTITVFTAATSTVAGGGGAAVVATYTKYNFVLTNPFSATLGSNVITVAEPWALAATSRQVFLTASTNSQSSMQTRTPSLRPQPPTQRTYQVLPAAGRWLLRIRSILGASSPYLCWVGALALGALALGA